MGDSKENFWDLGEFKRPSKSSIPSRSNINFRSSTEAVEISVADNSEISPFFDGKLTRNSAGTEQITKFIPPHSDKGFVKKHVLFEYEPENPLIKSVKVFSDKPDEKLFVESNLFIRERNALLDRSTSEHPPVPFYSYSPRYSQLNKSQLRWYLWWRENTRKGIFLKTDESYIMLYAYELAATGDGEDKQKALSMLCSLLTEFSTSDLGIVYKIMIRDIICDFCLIHKLKAPMDKLFKTERQVLLGSFLPEFFIDFSQSKELCSPAVASLSLYDYRRSKCYTESNAKIYKQGVDGAINAVFGNDEAFNSITSFTKGVYSAVTNERHPFNRMVNIINKSIKLEIVFYELSSIKTAVTDIVRYSENKIREHLGIRNKIHVLTINPLARSAIDEFFAQNMPPRQFVDRRRKDARAAQEVHEYDKLYDVPKVEISPERALEIERLSWDTTKKLTEAFAYGNDIVDKNTDSKVSDLQEVSKKIPQVAQAESTTASPTEEQSLYGQLYSKLGKVAEFINLCRGSNLITQRKFASSYSTTTDELADKINETAVELFGDIILENDGGAYTIIQDYLFLFD